MHKPEGFMREWTRVKVSGASEKYQGKRLAGNRSHLVTIETGGRHDNGSVGRVEDAQQLCKDEHNEMWV